MIGVCFQDIEKVTTESLADAKIESPKDAVVKVQLAGLCGSDLHPFFGREKGIDRGTVMGHEFVGEVVEVGGDVSSLAIGDIVAAPFSTSCGSCFYCDQGLTSRCVDNQLFGWRSNQQGLHGGQAEAVRVPNADGTLFQLKDTTPEIGLLLGDNLSTGYYCAEMAESGPGKVLAVIGCGTVGLLCVMSCFARGADRVFAFDPGESRLKKAEELGATTFSNQEEFVNAVASATDGRGADAVMELVGLPAAQQLAFQVIRPGGIMSVIGCHCTPDFSFSPVDAYDKNLTYRTGRCSARYYAERMTDVVKKYESQLQSMITHRFRLDECELAYDVFSKRKDGCVKAVFEL